LRNFGIGGILSILIEKTERHAAQAPTDWKRCVSDTTNIQYSIVNIQFGPGLSGRDRQPGEGLKKKSFNPNVAKAGGLQSQGVKGEVVVVYLESLTTQDMKFSVFPAG
jgi:hypothetical protein